MPEDKIDHIDFDKLNQNSISKPLITKIYTADPSAHVFNGKIYIYPSHDIDAGEAFDDLGSHFAMEDYHVISMDSISEEMSAHDELIVTQLGLERLEILPMPENIFY